MNNEQFRKLMLANSSAKPSPTNQPKQASPHDGSPERSTSQQWGGPSMMPRTVAGAGKSAYTRQASDDNPESSSKQKQKFRSSAPRGMRLADGYVDRAKERAIRLQQEEEDRAERIRALEEALDEQKIDRATFEKQRAEIEKEQGETKGLDFSLLRGARKGDDGTTPDHNTGHEDGSGPADDGSASPEAGVQDDENIEDELERLEAAETTALAKEKAQKKGQLSTVSVASGKKRTRDQILAEMKAARDAAKAKSEESALGSRFKKISARKQAGSRIERDGRGREVLIIVDEDGHEKRKVRKVAGDTDKEKEAFVPDRNAQVLGMEVPEYARRKQEEEEARRKAEEEKAYDNIFDEVGSDYDPLGGLGSGSDDDDSDGDGDARAESGEVTPDAETKEQRPSDGKDLETPASGSHDESMPPPPQPKQPATARNYFQGSKTALVSAEESSKAPSLTDPSVMAALKKAKALNAAAKSEEGDKEKERQARLQRMLQNSDRDADDMDVGFGSSRLVDDEEADESSQAKLSAWGDESGQGGSERKHKRKRGQRGARKRKGDGNNTEDVMRVLERRKEDK